MLGNRSTLAKAIYNFKVSHVADRAAQYGTNFTRAILQNTINQYNLLRWLSSVKPQLKTFQQLTWDRGRSVDIQEPFISTNHHIPFRSCKISVSSAGTDLAVGFRGACYPSMLDSATGARNGIPFKNRYLTPQVYFSLDHAAAAQVTMLFANAFTATGRFKVKAIHPAVSSYGCYEISNPWNYLCTTAVATLKPRCCKAQTGRS